MIKVRKYLTYAEQKDKHRAKSLDGIASQLLRNAGFRNTAVNSRHKLKRK